VSGVVAYMVVSLLTFFAGSFIVARYCHEGPMYPPYFLILVGVSLIWPITLSLTAAIILFILAAKLATRLSDAVVIAVGDEAEEGDTKK